MRSTGRQLRTSRPLRLNAPNSLNTNGLSSLRYLSKGDMAGTKGVSWNGENMSKRVMKASVAVSESVWISTEPQTKSGNGLASSVAHVRNAALRVAIFVVRRKSWKQQIQMKIEKGLVDSRFFTLLAVGGSLLGSVLCFVEGSYFVLESYLEYFKAMSQGKVQGHVVQLLIESLDMFLLGCAFLTFGMGLYALFVGSTNMNKADLAPRRRSNLFGLFHCEKLPPCVEVQSVSQAKSRIGHSVIMILQVGVIEKFKNVPVITGLDLACFAGAILVLSAGILLLSRLAID